MNLKLFPEMDKVKLSIEFMQELEPEEGFYLAFSGGKDSIVLHKLAEMAGIKFDSHYSVTTVDPPELMRFIRENYPAVHWEIPEMTMWDLIPTKLMPPTRVVRYCCEVLKENGGKGRKVLTGIRAMESTRRSTRKSVEFCYRDSTKQLINPIIHWSESEVWTFIKAHNLKYPALYDQGFNRLGCVGCPLMGAAGMKRDFERWPTIRKKYIQAFEKMLEVRKIREIETKWKSGEEVMSWWLKEDVREMEGALMEVMYG